MNPYTAPRTRTIPSRQARYGRNRSRQLPGHGNTALVCGLIGLIIPLLGAVALVMGFQGLSGNRPQKTQAMIGIALGALTMLVQVLAIIILVRARSG